MQSMHSTAPRAARGFSLVEMLLAVFILGIGVISIAALFPAGISLQRQATDDVVGPIVAKNALATLRSKLSQDDFGGYNDFGLVPSYIGPDIAGTISTAGGQIVPQVNGDWAWMRPGFVFDSANTPQDDSAIDVFSAGYTRRGGVGAATPALPPTLPQNAYATETPDGVLFKANHALFGIPYNPKKYPLFTDRDAAAQLNPVSQHMIEPLVTFTQSERSWPQGPANYGVTTPSGVVPQYYWDCMFRRNGGRVQVAVFVYRVNAPGGETRGYAVSRLDNTLIGTPPAGSVVTTASMPPIPMMYMAPNPGTAASWPNRSTNDIRLADEIPGTGPGTAFGAAKIWDDWMSPGAVWVDNLGNTHKVLRGRMVAGATGSTGLPNQGPVKLQRQIPVMPRSPVNGVAPNTSAQGFNAWISAIWFLPVRDAKDNVITPVYVTVEEL